MNTDSLITLVICLGAVLYVGKIFRSFAQKLLAPPQGECGGGCSGCGPSEPELVTLKRK